VHEAGVAPASLDIAAVVDDRVVEIEEKGAWDPALARANHSGVLDR
jgi:hypothetical protein